MYTVYGIPNCDTVKKSLDALKSLQVTFEFHDYKKKGIDRETISNWLKQYPWDELVNKKGLTWKQLPETERPKNEAEAIELMLVKTSVIRRPIVAKNASIKTIGFEPEKFKEL